MDSDTMVRFARRYSDLGTAVQEQFDSIMDGRYRHLNPNAVEMIGERLTGFHDDIDTAIAAALEYHRDGGAAEDDDSDEDDE